MGIQSSTRYPRRAPRVVFVAGRYVSVLSPGLGREASTVSTVFAAANPTTIAYERAPRTFLAMKVLSRARGNSRTPLLSTLPLKRNRYAAAAFFPSATVVGRAGAPR